MPRVAQRRQGFSIIVLKGKAVFLKKRGQLLPEIYLSMVFLLVLDVLNRSLYRRPEVETSVVAARLSEVTASVPTTAW